MSREPDAAEISGEADAELEALLNPHLSRRLGSGWTTRLAMNLCWTLLAAAATIWLALARRNHPRSARLFTADNFATFARHAAEEQAKRTGS